MTCHREQLWLSGGRHNKTVKSSTFSKRVAQFMMSGTASSAHRQEVQPMPDRCWSKAALACAATVLTAATHSNCGFFFVAFMRLFDANRETGAWPTSVFQAADECCGFIGLGLQKFFAVSTVGLIGSVLFWAGILLSAFAPNLTWMTVTFGAVQGAGSGIVCLTVTLIVMMYFDRYRGIAIGIRYAGYSLSSLIYAPVLARLGDTFSFNQVLLLFAGISLHLTPLVLLLKEPPWMSSGVKSEKTSAQDPTGDGSQCFTAGHCYCIKENRGKGNQQIVADFIQVESENCAEKYRNKEVKGMRNLHGLAEYDAKTATKKTDRVIGELPTVSHQINKVEAKNALILSPQKEPGFVTLLQASQKECSVEEKWPTKNRFSANGCNGNAGGPAGFRIITRAALETETHGETFDTKSGISSHGQAAMQCNRKEGISSNWMFQSPNDQVEELAIPSCDGCKRVPNGQPDQTAEGSSWRSYLVIFWLFVLGGVLADYSDSAILSTIVDSALDRGATSLQADLAITCAAPSQLIGRTLLPVIADLGFINRNTMTCASYFLFAASVAALSATRTFSTYVAAAAFVSISTGSLMTMKHVVAADYFGVDAVAATWAACGALITLLFFCSPSIFGFFRDRLGCYDQFYYSLATVHTLVGILFFFLNVLGTPQKFQLQL
ncbi:uncharacterized protein LOC144146725 [Haemaphysalis longicornis]